MTTTVYIYMPYNERQHYGRKHKRTNNKHRKQQRWRKRSRRRCPASCLRKKYEEKKEQSKPVIITDSMLYVMIPRDVCPIEILQRTDIIIGTLPPAWFLI